MTRPAGPDVKVGDDIFHNSPGFAWYQTVLPTDLPRPSAGGALTLHFVSVDDNATVFVNGKQVASHKGWNEPFDVPLDGLAAGAAATLSVLVENTAGAGGLAGPVTVEATHAGAPVAGWKMRGGVEAGLSWDGLEAAGGRAARRGPAFLPRPLRRRPARRDRPAPDPPAADTRPVRRVRLAQRPQPGPLPGEDSGGRPCICPSAGSSAAGTH